jgi:hypothetical protein
MALPGEGHLDKQQFESREGNMKSEEFTTHEACVKCGSKRQSIRHNEQATEGTIVYQVYCQDCEAVGSVGKSRAKAVELWDLEQKATRETK